MSDPLDEIFGPSDASVSSDESAQDEPTQDEPTQNEPAQDTSSDGSPSAASAPPMLGETPEPRRSGVLDIDDVAAEIEAQYEDAETTVEWESYVQRLLRDALEHGKESEEFKTVVDELAQLYNDRDRLGDARKDESDRLSDLAKADHTFAENLRSQMHQFFLENELEKVRTPRYNPGVRGIGGHPPVILNDDVDAKHVPSQFVRVRRSVSKTKVREALQAGEDVTALVPDEEKIKEAIFEHGLALDFVEGASAGGHQYLQFDDEKDVPEEYCKEVRVAELGERGSYLHIG